MNFQGERRFYPIKEEKYDLQLFIPEKIYNSQTYSTYAIATYCAIKALCNSSINHHCLTPYQITYYLTMDKKPTKRMIKYIKTGLDELIENRVVIHEGSYQTCYFLNCDSIWFDTEKERFTIISFNEVQIIFKAKNVNCFLLLKFCVFLIGTISASIEVYLDAHQSKTRVVGNLTIDFIAEKSGISIRTVIEYTKILEELGLLYVNRQNDFVIDDKNNIKQLSNVYGRPCDKEYIDIFASNQQKYKSSYRYIQKNINTVNNNRRFAQMFNQLKKSNENNEKNKYSNGEIQDIYNYVVSENKKYELLYEKNKYEEYLEKIRDTDIFNKYDFIRKETK
ncbi:hypothetical protein [Konateibacter massiliensis]|uniref:hypothetical protein n=1 Tax=Konateibacter massiliensis TaxID=2002841 RepID=UPI00117A2F7C|nr:hypothetical protein [Konateibacter massiliensis]